MKKIDKFLITDEKKEQYFNYWFVNQWVESKRTWIKQENYYTEQIIFFRFKFLWFAISLKIGENAKEYVYKNRLYIKHAVVSNQLYKKRKNVFLIEKFVLKKQIEIPKEVYLTDPKYDYYNWSERNKIDRYLHPKFFEKQDRIEKEKDEKKILYDKNYKQNHCKNRISDEIRKQYIGKLIINSYVITSSKQFSYNNKLNSFVIRFKYNNQKCISKIKGYNVDLNYIKKYIKKGKMFIISAEFDNEMYNVSTFLVNNIKLELKENFVIEK